MLYFYLKELQMSKPIKLLMIVVDFAIEEISRYKDPEKVKAALDHLQKAYLSL